MTEACMSLEIYGGRPYFWQWDTGQQLVVQDDECGEVHFCNGTSDQSLVVEIRTLEDGTRVADVPNILLQRAITINAYLYQVTESGEQTIRLHRFRVMPRTKPTDYVYTETEVKTWERLEEEIRAAIDLVGYYTPVHDPEKGMIHWEASRPGMPDVDPVELPEGPQGDPGKDFTYEDFTPEQLEALRGPQGDPGKDFTYEDFTPEQLEDLRGPQGDPGKTAYEYAQDGGYTGTVEKFIAEMNYLSGLTGNVQKQLNGKVGDFTYEIYNGTGGNPKPVRFASFNYSACDSENGIAAKISLVSGHGNGSSYAFLADAIIKVGHNGAVSVDNFKYYGAATGSYDGADRQYGDIFWLIDAENKIVDFYVLMGQYARMYQTPWKRLTYSSKGTVTQHTSVTIYSSGEKTWANNSEIVLQSDLPTKTENWTFTLEDGSTVTKAVYVG